MSKTKNQPDNEKDASAQENRLLSAPAHKLTCEQLISELQANVDDGLKSQEAERRLEVHGPNELEDTGGVSPLKIFIRQIANAMTLILLLAMAVSFGIESYIEGGVVAAVIILNVTIGFHQEMKAQKTMDSLKSLSSPTASVVRDGKSFNIPTRQVVAGDMVELKTGDTIPADIRLVEAVNFETDEALLTGESLPVEKDANSTFPEVTGPADRLNVAFSSSTVTKGRARGFVFATGMYTEIGSIAAALRSRKSKKREVKRRADGSARPHRYAQAWTLTVGDAVGTFLGVNVGTPLQKRLSRLALFLFGVAIICAIIVLAANNFADYDDVHNSNPTQEVAIYAVATGLSMIPASLVVILTITMAAGTRRMVERNVIVRNMNAVEALGGITDICSDKTGTLTQGKMVVQRAWIPANGTYSVDDTNEPFNPTVGSIRFGAEQASDPEKSLEKVSPQALASLIDGNLLEYLKVASLANSAVVHETGGEWKARGDPTEIAIQVFAARFGWNRKDKAEGVEPSWTQVAEFPFDSDVKKMSVIFKDHETGKNHVFSKGAVERIIDSCTSIYLQGESDVQSVTPEIKENILENMEAITSSGLRCLALASREYAEQVQDGKELDRNLVEQNLTFRGLIGLYDAPRPESEPAVRACHEAGITVHMLTGDHPGTARAIAKQVGILPKRMDHLGAQAANSMVMTATQFDRLSDDQIDAMPLLPLVIARCAPHTKVKMIEALQRRKRFTAMTGDGVNDSPSLKAADVGIGMGQSGSDVAKDASDIILTDDNFASIVNAIEEGRRMFDNIKKFILHLLSQNIAQAFVLLTALAFKDARGLSVFPLSPVEILWVIMCTSSLPDMGLGFERASKGIMKRPTSSFKSGVFRAEVLIDMVVYGLWIAALCLGAFSLVVWGFGNGQLGGQPGTTGCNKGYSPECDLVFRARATCFATLTWFSVFLAWEMLDMRRSFFAGKSTATGSVFTRWMKDVWANRFLFWSVVAGFLTVIPLLYIPVINHDVFVHTGISWEWGIVFVAAVLFFMGVESWKWAKRVFFRIRAHNRGKVEKGNTDSESCVFGDYISSDEASS